MEETAAIEAASPSRRRSVMFAAWVLVPALLGSLVLAQARWFGESTCETFDEFTYLRMGICIYRHGDFKSLASPMCPPLPILLEYWLPALRARSTPGTDDWQREVPTLIRQARLVTSLLIGVPLVWVVYGWLARRRGWASGALGGGLVALSPTVIAAGSIATTDACFVLFALIALAALRCYQLKPSRWTFAAVGASIGLALASKQSGVLLFAVALMEMLLRIPARKPGATRVDFGLSAVFWLAKRLAGLIGLALVVDWAVYGFHFAPKFGDVGTQIPFPVIIPMVAEFLPNSEAIVEAARQWGPPLALDTLFGQIYHASSGHHAFLMGELSHQGWWYFFPVAIAIKSTPAELAMMGLVVVLACRRATWRNPARRLWLGSALILLGLGMGSKINIGHRYMLLIYPMVALIVADSLGELALRRSRWAIAIGALLLAWQGVSAWGIAPHYLGYFNSSCGGPTQGYRYLLDSSLDWGQDLPWLRRELEARGYRRVALCYFGTANASAYGLRAMGWTSPNESEARECDWLAISATAMRGVYGGHPDLYRRIEGLPSIRVGYSIFLYDLKDPRVRAVWESYRGSSNLQPVVGEAAPP